MRKRSFLAASVMAGLLVVGLASCRGFFVNPTLSSITVTPATPTVAKGSTQQFTATATNDDGSTSSSNLKNLIWASSDPTVATISSTGLATTLKVGTTTISASSGIITGSTTLTVTTNAALTSIAVTAASSTVSVGGTDQLTATGTFADGTTGVDITSSVTWTSQDTNTATVSSTGLVTGMLAGTTAIQAAKSSGGTTITGSVNITVQ